MVKRTFNKKAPPQPHSKSTPKGGKMIATMILMMSAQTMMKTGCPTERGHHAIYTGAAALFLPWLCLLIGHVAARHLQVALHVAASAAWCQAQQLVQRCVHSNDPSTTRTLARMHH